MGRTLPLLIVGACDSFCGLDVLSVALSLASLGPKKHLFPSVRTLSMARVHKPRR